MKPKWKLVQRYTNPKYTEWFGAHVISTYFFKRNAEREQRYLKRTVRLSNSELFVERIED